MRPPETFTLDALSAFHAAGGSPVAVADTALSRIAAWADPALFLTRVEPHAVRARAAALAAEGPQGRPLYGVPFVVKDNIDCAGLPTTAGCPDYAYTPAEDAPVVARLLKAGAILLGKVNLDQFATGLNGTRSPHGTPRNALLPSHVPGGSSSGSATAVAAGIAAFSLGTDTAGSGRVPAMANNIVGLKPSLGLIPSRGMVPACRSLDTVSIFALTVADAAAVLAVAAGPDAADPYSRPAPPFWRAAPAPQPAWRLAAPLPAQLSFDTPGDAALYEAALGRAQALGASLARVDIAPFLAIARRLYDGAWVAERTAALREFLTARPESVHPVTRTILEAGLDKRTVDAWEDFHAAAEARRLARALFAGTDALLLPTAPGLPSLATLAAEPVAANSRLGTYTNFVNICDLAALAIPAGFTAAGLPAGLTLIGPAFSEARLAGLGAALHATAGLPLGALGTPTPPPPVPPTLAADELPLLAIGAHMSGLPLNPQLLRHGGRFLRAATTAPHYRLHDLGNRPGMARVASGGIAIAGEIWALPATSLGPFLAEIPPPLGFGRVTLSDGSTPLGFLAEAAALADAPDISAHGGWRAYLAAKDQA
ncbi:allophanate hydrolase [Siccirubricoccus sp. KC 17139]|uniref:Allophanate hydrolase n=1 Tax=Siccirubricoccus soli TaxID=2899147 RepID=A0ABT1D6Z9_9PROT|nr:allophanate hydrolase [Siccirubricoccus soli]MCO6417714.1 allophanate hydrolase [Siccirubricoccus soli]MCP2683849.1 allophanate hydrolase [Siccirubricoccus soli]